MYSIFLLQLRFLYCLRLKPPASITTAVLLQMLAYTLMYVPSTIDSLENFIVIKKLYNNNNTEAERRKNRQSEPATNNNQDFSLNQLSSTLMTTLGTTYMLFSIPFSMEKRQESFTQIRTISAHFLL